MILMWRDTQIELSSYLTGRLFRMMSIRIQSKRAHRAWKNEKLKREGHKEHKGWADTKSQLVFLRDLRVLCV